MTSRLPSLVDPVRSPTDLSRIDHVRRISNSEVQTFKRCRRKWWLAYYRHLQPRREAPVGPMAMGTRIHRALQYHYQTQVPGSLERINALDALEALIERDRETLLSDPDVFESVETQFSKEADVERIMISGYLDWLAETGDDSNYEVVGAEVYQEADLDTSGLTHKVPVKLIARLDLRVRRLSDGAIFFLDHKTTISFAQLTKSLPTNEQMLWYILIEYLSKSQQHVHGALYNMIRRVKRTAKAKPPFYERYSVYHNLKELEAFNRRTQGVIETILTTEVRLDNEEDHRFVAYPTPTRDCSWDCPFYAACKMMDDGSHAEELLNDAFIIGDPYAYYASNGEEKND